MSRLRGLETDPPLQPLNILNPYGEVIQLVFLERNMCLIEDGITQPVYGWLGHITTESSVRNNGELVCPLLQWGRT